VQRKLAAGLAAGRVAVGVALMLAPERMGSRWIGWDAERPGTVVFARALGARDLAIAIGVLESVRRGGPLRGWLAAGVLADATDFAATAAAGDALPRRARLASLVVAGGAAATGAALAASLD
jgi:hypothetical protein